MKKILISSAIIFPAIAERIWFDLGPNVELVTMALVIASMYLGTRYSLFTILTVMVVSDIIIGNSSVFVFTWTGFLLPALVLPKLLKNNSFVGKIMNGTAAGIGANVFFFLWTNFGVWLISSMYPNTAQGLMLSYLNGLPFLKLQLLSTILFVPFGVIIFEFAKSLLALRSHGLLPEKA